MRSITLEILKEERKKGTHELVLPYSVDGQVRFARTRIVNGEMETFGFPQRGEQGYRPLGEMITTPAGLDSLVQKTVVDLQLGREAVPLLYTPIYRRMEDPNFTENVDVTPFTGASVVFLQHMELGEVAFGARRVGAKETVPIVTYTAGLEWTEDIVLYDKTWEVAEAARAMGEAYNALLNHIHLSPILTYAYAAKNQTPADNTGGTYREKLRNTIKAGLIHASQDENTDTRARRRPTIILAHSSKRWDIEEVLARMVIGGTEYPAIGGLSTAIYYDGYSVVMGEKTYTYEGCDPGKAYLIDPTKYFRELVKHDLRVDAAGPDLKRLVENAIVGRVRRGVIASPANAVEELTLP